MLTYIVPSTYPADTAQPTIREVRRDAEQLNRNSLTQRHDRQLLTVVRLQLLMTLRV